MATFLASVVAGSSIDFMPGTDALEFVTGSASQLLLRADGNDLLVGLEGENPVRLVNTRFSDLVSSSLLFVNDSQFRIGTGTSNFLFGFDGNDYLDGLGGSDTLDGGSGHDLLRAGPASDLLLGGSGQDILDGGGGRDTLDGGEGDDTYRVPDARTRIVDTGGFDRAIVSASHVKLPSTVEQVDFVGGAKALPYWIDALLPDAASGQHFAGLLDSSKTLYFSFPSTLPGYGLTQTDGNGFSGFNTQQKAFARDALMYASRVVDLQFVESPAASARNTIAFGNNSQPASTAYAYLPSEDLVGSDVFLGSNTTGNLAPLDGSYAALTLIHEIGHALGLEHPLNRGSDAPFLAASEDDTRWTVMSYNDDPAQYHLAYSPLDIAALQYLYGPSTLARNGDDTYLVDPSSPHFVWDGGGTDTLSASALSQGVTLSLEPGDWSWVGNKAGLITAPGQVTVNFGSLLENLLGGGGADRLIGNTVGNVIDGASGDDTVDGGDGADSLLGGPGLDSLTGGAGNDTLRGGWQSDTLLGGDGNDFLNAGKSADLLDGGPGNDHLNGAMDNDTLLGGSGADSLEGSHGDDHLLGGPDADTVVGGAGDDFLSGGQGADQLSGGDGNDTLSGGLGADQLAGGSGADHFVFRTPLSDPGGMDILVDLEPAVDVLELSANMFAALAGSLGLRVGISAHLQYDGTSGILAYDADGAGGDAAVGFAVVGTVSHPVVMGDIFLIVG